MEENRILVLKNFNTLIPRKKRLTKKIENGIWLWSCEYAEKHNIEKLSSIFQNLYKNKAISIYSNLKKKSYVQNVTLLANVKSGDIEASKLAFMTPQELFTERWKKLLDRKFKIDKNLYQTRSEMATDMYKCGKCKKRVCTYFQLQTRSADEPMTTFVTCLKCGNRWKH